MVTFPEPRFVHGPFLHPRKFPASVFVNSISPSTSKRMLAGLKPFSPFMPTAFTLCVILTVMLSSAGTENTMASV